MAEKRFDSTKSAPVSNVQDSARGWGRGLRCLARVSQRKMAMLSDVSFTKQSHRCLVLIAEPDMETAVSPRKLRVFFIRSSLKKTASQQALKPCLASNCAPSPAPAPPPAMRVASCCAASNLDPRSQGGGQPVSSRSLPPPRAEIGRAHV